MAIIGPHISGTPISVFLDPYIDVGHRALLALSSDAGLADSGGHRSAIIAETLGVTPRKAGDWEVGDLWLALTLVWQAGAGGARNIFWDAWITVCGHAPWKNYLGG